MKKIQKLFILVGLMSLPLIFCGCQTMENVKVFSGSEGNIIFFRKTSFTLKKAPILSLEFDITVNENDTTILKDPVLNYTLEIPSTGTENPDNVVFKIENDGKRYSIYNTEKFFKEIDKKRNIKSRYSSTIKLEDFEEIISNNLPVSVVLILSDGREILLSSKEMDEKFTDLRIILK